MAKLPQIDQLKSDMESGLVLQERRPYIGMSSLGGPCQRKIWYDFYWTYLRYVTKRTQRIYDRGHLEERRVINDLQDKGIIVSDTQIEFSDKTGHIKGHCDGKAVNIPTAEKTVHLLEIKTMNEKRFKTYLNKGIIESDFTYWVQINLYMGYANLKRCLFIVTNKNNEERSYKRYEFDKGIFNDYSQIGFDILVSEEPPKKVGDKTWHVCKMCDARGVCHSGDEIEKTCRSCQYVNIEMEGRWTCTNPHWHEIHDEKDIKYSNTLTRVRQLNACPLYTLSEIFE